MRILGVSLLLCGICLAAASCTGSGSAPARPAPTTPGHAGNTGRNAGGASLFRLPMPDGTPVTVKTPAAIFFFTTWCGYCKQAMPEINRLAARARNGGIRVYGVDVRENPQLVDGFVRQYNPNFPVLVDESGAVADRYGVRGYPTFVVIDENANVVYNGHEVPRNF